jgi:hypothetical protein
MVLLTSRHPEGSGRQRGTPTSEGLNRTYDHSAQETEIYADWNRSVYVQSHSGCTRTQSLVSANKDHRVVEEGRELVVERGAKLGAEPSDKC